MNVTYWLAIIVALPIAISGCGGEVEKKSSSSVTDPDPTDPGSQPPNVVNALGFYIQVVDQGKFTSYMSKGTAFDTDCLVATDETATKDLTCTIDIQELDLNYHGLILNYNVPPALCKYVRMTPYSYYNYESGKGPSAISMDVNEVGDVKTVTACSVTTEGGVVAGCTGHLEVAFDTANVGFKCEYDKSSTGDPNCCFGNYTFTKNLSGDRVATEIQTLSWSGNYEKCVSGPAWNFISKAGFRLPFIQFSDAGGLNSTYEVTPAIKINKAHNFTASNFYTGISAPGPATTIVHSHDGYVEPRVSTRPYAIDPVDDRDGSPMPSALFPTLNPSYMMECLDTAKEVKHRIQVYIREWNTYSQFITYGTSLGVTGNPDINGVEGTDCAYGGIAAVYGCNDSGDWDDWLNKEDGDLSVTTDLYDTNGGSESTRVNYYPMETDSI